MSGDSDSGWALNLVYNAKRDGGSSKYQYCQESVGFMLLVSYLITGGTMYDVGPY